MANESLEREVVIDERPVKFRASGATPRYYRNLFGRDIWLDFDKLSQDMDENGSSDGNSASNLSVQSIEIFEDLAYCMAKQADPDIPDIDSWFDQFSVFAIFEVLPVVTELWQTNVKTLQQPKKKPGPQHAK